MATYIFHRRIMGKVKIDNFFVSQWVYLILFLQKCLLSSPLFRMVFVQITEFDWLPGRQKRLILEKMLKKSSSQKP